MIHKKNVGNLLTADSQDAIIIPALCSLAAQYMRPCWNWQTGTFEVRVSLTYGFKSRFSHHIKRRYEI